MPWLTLTCAHHPGVATTSLHQSWYNDKFGIQTGQSQSVALRNTHFSQKSIRVPGGLRGEHSNTDSEWHKETGWAHWIHQHCEPNTATQISREPIRINLLREVLQIWSHTLDARRVGRYREIVLYYDSGALWCPGEWLFYWFLITSSYALTIQSFGLEIHLCCAIVPDALKPCSPKVIVCSWQSNSLFSPP